MAIPEYFTQQIAIASNVDNLPDAKYADPAATNVAP
jgi:hypothetical protein